MNKVKTLDDLRKMRETLRSTLDIREKSNHPEQMVQIRISMATCGIAAGAKEIMNYFIEALDREPDAWGIAMPNRLSRLPCQVKNLLFSDM